MRLQELDIIVTAPPAPGWGGRYWILVKVTSDTGITGWGECYAASVGPDAMTHVIRDLFERHFFGENPENIERLFRKSYSSGFTQRPDLTVMGAYSGLEMACWDILGKDRDRPVYALLGGLMNERLRAYSYLYPLPDHAMEDFWTSPEMAAESALDLVARGYTAVKFDPAGPYPDCYTDGTFFSSNQRRCAGAPIAVGLKPVRRLTHIARSTFHTVMLTAVATAAPSMPHSGTSARLRAALTAAAMATARALCRSKPVMFRILPTGPIAALTSWPAHRMANAAAPAENSAPKTAPSTGPPKTPRTRATGSEPSSEARAVAVTKP